MINRHTFFISILLYVLHVNSAIFDNCIRYANTTVGVNSICLECRDGFYVTSGQCQTCMRSSDSPTCNISKTVPQSLTSTPKPQSTLSTISPPLIPKLQQNPSKIILQPSQKLQNCKQVDTNSKCIVCFNNYKLNTQQNICQKISFKDRQQKIRNCLVFSEIDNKCLMCQDNFVLDQNNICNNQIILQNTTNIVIEKKDSKDKNDIKFIQADNITNLPLLQITGDLDKNKIFSASAPSSPNVTNSIKNSQVLTVSPTNTPIKLSNGTSPIPPKIQIPTVDPLKKNNDTCAQYSISQACIKCISGYVLNTSLNSCAIQNKTVQINTQIKSNATQTTPTDSNKTNNSKSNQGPVISVKYYIMRNPNNTSNSTINNAISTSNASANSQTSSSASGLTSISSTTNNVTSNSNNSVFNSSSSSPSSSASASASSPSSSSTSSSSSSSALTSGSSNNNIITSPIKNIINTNSITTANVPNSTINNTTNSPISNNSSIVLNVNTANTNNNTANITNTSTNSTIIIPNNTSNTTNNIINPRPSGNNNNNTNSSNTTNTPKYNITTFVDPRTKLTITIIGTTRNPPTTLPNCIRYRDISYECVQCESGYNLYIGSCYDKFSYSQIVRGNKFTYNQIGIGI